jgi:hypothetical protein
MWIRLAAVCMLGSADVLALRATTGPRPYPASAIDAGPADIGLVNQSAKSDKLPTVDENESKIVNVERIRLTSPLQANAKVEPELNRETHDRRRVVHRHWHHASRRIRRH